MIKNPLVIFSGLAISALAGLLGVTKDRWYQAEPPVATVAGAPAVEPGSTAPQTTEGPTSEQTAAKPAEAPVAENSGGQAQIEETPVEAPKSEPVQTEIAKTAPPAPEPPKTGQSEIEKTETAAPEAPIGTMPKSSEPAAQTQIQKSEPPKPEEPAAKVAEVSQPEQPAAKPETQPPNVTEINKAAAPDAPGFDTVRVAKTGEAVIAGRAGAGAEVTVKLNGKAIGTAVANAEGAFVVVPDEPLPAGSGALTLEARGAGETVATQSSEVVAIALPEDRDEQAMVAVVSPDQPTEVLQKPEAQPAKPPSETKSAAVSTEDQPPAKAPAKTEASSAVSLDAVDYDDLGNIVFSGRGKPSAAIRLYVDNQAIGEALMDGRGHWSFSGSGQIAPGTHQLRVDEIDAAGRVSSRVELPFFREEASKVALAVPGTAETAPPAQTEAAPIPEPMPAKPTAAAEPQPEIAPPPPAPQPQVAAAPEPEPQPAKPAVSAEPEPEPEVAPSAAAPEPQVAAAPTPEPQPAKPAVSAEPEPTPSAAAPEPQVAAVKPAEQAAPKPEPQPAKPAAAAEPEPEIAPPASAPEPQIAAAQPAEQSAAPEPQPAEPAVSAEPQPEIAPSAAVPDPEPQIAAVQPVEKLRDGRIVIQPGNNLWKLSRVIYGRGIKYTVIYEANKDHIRDPDLIYPGQVFKTPDAVPPVTIDPVRRTPLTPEEGGSTVQ